MSNLEILHTLLVEELLRKIQTGEASSSDLNVARQLLKDNSISSDMTNVTNPIFNLVEELPFSDQQLKQE